MYNNVQSLAGWLIVGFFVAIGYAVKLGWRVLVGVATFPFYLVRVFRTSNKPLRQMCKDAWKNFPVLICTMALFLFEAGAVFVKAVHEIPDSDKEELYFAVDDLCFALSDAVSHKASIHEYWHEKSPRTYEFMDSLWWGKRSERHLGHRHEQNLMLIEHRAQSKSNKPNNTTNNS